ncbi:hypothetical protein AT1219_50314 [Vibrio alginolyticus]
MRHAPIKLEKCSKSKHELNKIINHIIHVNLLTFNKQYHMQKVFFQHKKLLIK